MQLLVKFLLNTIWATKIPVLRSLWWKLYQKVRKSSKKIKINLHGYAATQPAGYTYAFNSRLYSNVNNPLIECVNQAYNLLKRKIVVVDIGAAIGDTVYLLKANCPDMVKQFYCIDGDEEFFGYLKENMSGFSDVNTFKCILSDSNQSVSELVRIHAGTASAQGKNEVEAISFDHLSIANEMMGIDVFKIDVDGFDGKVIGGSKQTLSKYKPIVIFEWHPKLYINAGTDTIAPFKTLFELGYKSFIWYNKLGTFSHFDMGYNDETIKQYLDFCLNNSIDNDWHYDIVALHQDNKNSITSFANSDFSRRKISPY